MNVVSIVFANLVTSVFIYIRVQFSYVYTNDIGSKYYTLKYVLAVKRLVDNQFLPTTTGLLFFEKLFSHVFQR